MISVVIPTLNEARSLESLLPRLAREDEPAEITVVDGGSTDGSAEMAARLGVPAHSRLEIFPFADYVGLSSLTSLREKASQWHSAPMRPGPTGEVKLQTLDILMPDGSIRWSHDHDAIFTPERARALAMEGAAERKDVPIVIDPDGVKAIDKLVDRWQKMRADR